MNDRAWTAFLRGLPREMKSALRLTHEYEEWREAQGLEPNRAQKARFARCMKLAARWGLAYAPWLESA